MIFLVLQFGKQKLLHEKHSISTIVLDPFIFFNYNQSTIKIDVRVINMFELQVAFQHGFDGHKLCLKRRLRVR